MPYESILYEVETGKARITLNRPDKLNALEWHDAQFGDYRPGGRAAAKAQAE